MDTRTMKKEHHPEAYDWAIKCGMSENEIGSAWTGYIIGLYDAHADLRAAGKLPASAMNESVEHVDYDPSILTEDELQMWTDAETLTDEQYREKYNVSI